MKPISNFKSLIANSLIALFLLMANFTLMAQNDSPELKEFKILLEKDGNKIIMKCEKGCAWIDLSYENNKAAQAIDEYGMAVLNEVESDKPNNLTGFLFTVTKSVAGISLKGLKGTAWIDLSFSLSEGQKQMIDQNGMTKKK